MQIQFSGTFCCEAASGQHFLENTQLPSVLAGERRKSQKEAQEEKRKQSKGVCLGASPYIDILVCSEANSEDSSQQEAQKCCVL